VHALRRRLAGFAGTRLDAELMRLDVPGGAGSQGVEHGAGTAQQRIQGRAPCHRILDRLEPALDAAIQRVVVEALVMRLVRRAVRRRVIR
jgi:hypothetical protein